jgi:hypothetical protein
MKKNNLTITIIVAVVALTVGCFAGMKYQQSKQSSFGGQFGNVPQGQNQKFGNGNGTMMGNRGGFKPVNGDIVNMDDKSITIKLQDGSSKIVLFSDKTTVNKESTGSASDLKVGEKVAAFGTENSDGSVTAQSIQLNPVLRNSTGQK